MAMIAQTMRLTTPGERVIDLKGEMVFRLRASRFVFEKITKKAIAEGRLPDTIADDVVRTRAMVALPDNPSFPRRGRAFLLRNFVSVGCVRVAGMIVPRNQMFRIELPGQYSIVSPHGLISGPRFLDAGMHALAFPNQPAAVIWSRAAALGLSPFRRQYR